MVVAHRLLLALWCSLPDFIHYFLLSGREKMTLSLTPTNSSYKVVLAFLVIFSFMLFTSCQNIAGDELENVSTSSPSPTSSIFVAPTIQATFTPLPGDIYFLYQTQTAAPPTYPPIRWQTKTPTTPTPLYTLTARVIAVTKSSCLLAYPDFCISPDKRVGCEALGKYDFTVLTPDPYNYDKDNDGLGCDTVK
jgi:hypothetical protein